MLADADLAGIGKTLGDAHRARFLLALMGGEELSAGELAARSGASSSLASAHLSKLLGAGLIVARKRGRRRYYRLAGPQVSQALETLLTIAPPRKAQGLRDVNRGKAIRRARTCYDHLAGQLGVELTEALERRRLLRRCDGGWEVTPAGCRYFAGRGIDIPALRVRRRTLVRPCLDWTERRPHLAGALGAALAAHLFEQRFIEHLPGSRAVRVTPAGERHLSASLGLRLAA